jgi:hypothetical protein
MKPAAALAHKTILYVDLIGGADSAASLPRCPDTFSLQPIRERLRTVAPKAAGSWKGQTARAQQPKSF